MHRPQVLILMHMQAYTSTRMFPLLCPVRIYIHLRIRDTPLLLPRCLLQQALPQQALPHVVSHVVVVVAAVVAAVGRARRRHTPLLLLLHPRPQVLM